MKDLTERVIAATAGRDRVLDAAKAVALLLVVIGHSLAWHTTGQGTAVNVLEVEPGLIVLTWIFQVLPIFFAAGAVSNAASLHIHTARDFLRRRARRLLTPVLLYASVWTVVLLPVGVWVPDAEAAGHFLSQLLWFAGVYLVVVTAVPITVRWTSRPVLTLAAWFAVIAVVDAGRIAGAPESIAWVNLILVWAWLHQLGYHLPRLRRTQPLLLAGAALTCLLAALGLALAGPYSSSLVSIGGDRELSNLAPPSVVLVFYGAAQILLLAAAWPWLQRVLSRDALWTWVALVGARGMGIYLWHIPLVGAAAATALALGWYAEPLSPAWWVVHVLVVVIVIPLAWWVAGLAAIPEKALGRLPALFGIPPAVVGVVAGLLVLNISVTGFATWWGAGALGLPSLAAVNLALLWILWQGVPGTGRRPVVAAAR